MRRLRFGQRQAYGGAPPRAGVLRILSVPLAELYRSARAGDWAQIASSPLVLPVILIVTFAAFIPTLGTWFQADDFFFLENSRDTSIGTFILQAFDHRDTRPVPEFGFYRPLYIITFRLCYPVFGLHAVYYHVLNLTLHMASAAIVWLIARRLLRSVAGANFASLVFALHPAYTETLQWIARGNTVMVTFTYLLTLLAFMKYMDGGRFRALYFSGAVIGFAAAILYHTTALSLVAVLPAYAFLIAGRPADAIRWRSWVRFTPFFVMTAIMGFIQRDVGLGDAFKTGSFQYGSLAQYLGVALLPILPQDWAQFLWGGPETLIHLHMASSVVMIGFTLLLLDRRREPPYTGVFAVVWLFALIAPNTTSSLVGPITGIIPAQLYLPGTSLGVFAVLVAREVHRLLSPTLARRAASLIPLVAVGLIAFYAGLTLVHQDRESFFASQDRLFVAQLQEELPPPIPGATLYVASPPQNLVALTTVGLVSAVHVYYGDVDVKLVSRKEAIYIKAADPTQLVFIYER
jgi:hypothetical protein